MAGGVAAGDYDHDGDVDLFVSVPIRQTALLLENQGSDGFVDVSTRAGLDLSGVVASGPLFFDADSDGWLDLLVGSIEQGPLLFRNRRNGKFENVTSEWGLDAARPSVSAAAGDYDGDGRLDLFLAHWGVAVPACHLWKQQHKAGFRCVDAEVGLDSFFVSGGLDSTFSANFVDFEPDGQTDLLVTSDFGSSSILRNLGERGFKPWGVGVLSDENGMGSAVGDVDSDGDFDWFVSSIWDGDGVTEGDWGTSGNRLYRNMGDSSFADDTERAGVREGDWGWAACFADLDLDADLDLVQVNGWPQGAEQFKRTNARIFLGDGFGRFSEASRALGFDEHGDGRALVCFDYDRDGDIDLLVGNLGGAVNLWQNDSADAAVHYLSIALEGAAPNRTAIGALVSVTSAGKSQLRRVQAGSNFASQDPTDVHFGLGSATQVDLRVTWPDGTESRWSDVDTNRHLVLKQEATAAKPTPAPRGDDAGCSSTLF